jgi:hypothetical protein
MTRAERWDIAVKVNSSSITTSSVNGGGATWAKLTSIEAATEPYDIELWLGTITTTTGSSNITVSHSGSIGSTVTELSALEYTNRTGPLCR